LQKFAKRSAPCARPAHYDARMRHYVQLARPQRRSHSARRVRPAAAISRTALRSSIRPLTPSILSPAPSQAGFRADPYLDYGRFLTPEGGVLILYKDLDLRFRHKVWRIFAWTIATWLESRFLLDHSPVESQWINALCLILIAIVNGFILWKPPELYRSLEIRPDCMILEGRDVFWLRMMENGLPEFNRDKDGNQVLSGIYGTRHVEYLTARKFDDYDRMPEVFAAHLQQAMQQLWAPVLGLSTDHRNSAGRQRW
jgi:hypothetical protein